MDSPAVIALAAVPCALCGYADAAVVLRGQDWLHQTAGEFSVVRCRHCGLVYQNPQPTVESTALLYPEDYAPHDTPRAPQPSRTAWQHAVRALLENRYGYNAHPSAALSALLLPFDWLYSTVNFKLIPFRQNGRLLDIGCGSGEYLLTMRALGWQVSGVEISQNAVRLARETFQLDIHEGELLQAALPAESFDVVTMWWYLEHTHNPLEVLHEAFRLLRPGGLLALGVPHWGSLDRQIFGRAWYHLDLPRHFTFFSEATMSAMLKRAGFGRAGLRTGSWLDDPAYSVERWRQIREGRPVKLPTPVRRLLTPTAWLAARAHAGSLLLARAYKPAYGAV